jgi:anti-anti-sigma factor
MNWKVKIDTKEKFHVITPFGPDLPANLTDKIRNMMHGFLENPVKNVVFNAENVESMENEVADCLAALQADFQAHHASFVTCCLQPSVKQQLASLDLLDLLNVTPTESEAWDIVQMEEIEREIFGNENED